MVLVPEQWSAPSHAPPVDVPVQLAELGWKPSAGQAPDVPVQVSATSHGPADARQVKVDPWKTSIHVLLDPEQRSAPSHAPPFDVPVQLAVAGWKPFAGQAPDVPVHVSATSHGPADARQVVAADWKLSTHVLAVPLQ